MCSGALQACESWKQAPVLSPPPQYMSSLLVTPKASVWDSRVWMGSTLGRPPSPAHVASISLQLCMNQILTTVWQDVLGVFPNPKRSERKCCSFLKSPKPGLVGGERVRGGKRADGQAGFCWKGATPSVIWGEWQMGWWLEGGAVEGEGETSLLWFIPGVDFPEDAWQSWREGRVPRNRIPPTIKPPFLWDLPPHFCGFRFLRGLY